jgi:site-specific DNA recombinase
MTMIERDGWRTGVLHLRISEDRTGEEAGVQRQEEDGRAHAERRQVRLVAVTTENDVSAAGKQHRSKLRETLDIIRAGHADVIIARDWSRLSRNRRDDLSIFETGIEHQVTLMLYEGVDLDMASTAGRLMAEFQAMMARHSIEQRGEWQSRANLQAAQQGKRRGGRRPFGFEKNGITLRPLEAAAIYAGYHMLLTGASLAEIARRWNTAGLRSGQATRTGEPSMWRHDSVRNVLRNPRHAGLRAYKGEIIAKAEWQAIVGEDTWHAAQAILGNPARRTSRTNGQHLLTGVAVCDVCGATVHAGGSGRGYPTYRCGRTYAHISRKAEPLDEYARQLVIAWCSQPEALAAIARASQAPAGDDARDRVAAEHRLTAAAAQFADGDITDGQLRVITRRLRARIAELDTRLAAAPGTGALLTLVTAADLEAAWDTLTVSQQRTLIRALMTIRLKGPGRGVRHLRAEDVPIDWEEWAAGIEVTAINPSAPAAS